MAKTLQRQRQWQPVRAKPQEVEHEERGKGVCKEEW